MSKFKSLTRPEGEPPMWVGITGVAVIIVTAVGFVVALTPAGAL